MNRKSFLKLSVLAAPALLFNQAGFSLDESLSTHSNDVQFYKPTDALYDTLRKGFNKRILKSPAIIAHCLNTNGVKQAVLLARQKGWAVSIKSGGHCMEGFSVNNDGMMINLSSMNQIEWISPDTIRVQPACTLAQLYAELLPKGKILPGGSCASVAIGGLVLGGGYGLLARQFGLTCDSLLSVTMVDGNGNIITSEQDPSLLWACKGGNNGNFGAITSLTFKVHQKPATMQCFRFRSYKVTAEKAEAILKKWFEVTANLPPQCFSAYVLNGKTMYILLTNTGKMEPAIQTTIQALSHINQKTTKTGAVPIEKALSNFFGITHPVYFKNASAGLYKNYGEIEGCIKKALELVVQGSGMIYQVNTLGGKIQSPEFEKNSAFAHRAYPYFSELQSYWEIPSQEQRLTDRFQQVQQVFAQHGIKAHYRNYPDLHFNNWANSYYGANYQRLQQFKNKYDPYNLFRFEQSVRNI